MLDFQAEALRHPPGHTNLEANDSVKFERQKHIGVSSGGLKTNRSKEKREERKDPSQNRGIFQLDVWQRGGSVMEGNLRRSK